VKAEGLTQLHNVYPLSEFIRSTDPLFRPVDMTTAPDGTMYVTDMYRGIIQESQWSGPGSYLRRRIDQYQLDKVVKHGRIWRLGYSGMPRDTRQPRMYDDTSAALVGHLSHPNGWWRDTAQQILVMRQDASVVPAITTLARQSSNQLARIHALWTLEGLAALDPGLVRELMKSPEPQLRIQAIRASETLYKAGNQSFAEDYRALASGTDVDVTIQALMSLNTLKVANASATIKAVADANPAKGVQLVAKTIFDPTIAGAIVAPSSAPPPPRTAAEEERLARGRMIYTELCFTCHGDDGRGAPKPDGRGTMAPTLAASERVTGHADYVINVLLKGLTGPLNGVEYTEVMIPMGQQNDEWIAAISSYVRNTFGNRASLVTPGDVARVRQTTATRNTMWTATEVESTLPRPIVLDTNWKFTASHNPAIAHYATTIQPWSSGVPQQAGMWLQIELPRSARVTQIEFESPIVPVVTEPIAPGAPPRTAGGRGGAAAPAVATASGYPRAYQVQVSADGTAWSTPVAQGTDAGPTTSISFPPVEARFLRITQTATSTDAPPFAVQRLKVFAVR